ncbi:MAG: hypothetical protein HQL83_05365 [Magnetococcales bacterium]|nr:hypothetical protein [Magnetococcales bacterium]
MKSSWFERSSLTFRESAWILLGIDPDDVGVDNAKHPTDPLRPGHIADSTLSRYFNDYLQQLRRMYHDVAVGLLPLTREPWNRFPHCFVRTGHLATWSQTVRDIPSIPWAQHGVIPEPLPPPPPEWMTPPQEHPLLHSLRHHMIRRAATRQLHPMMKDEMERLLQWAASQEQAAALPAMADVKNTLRPLYKALRNLPVLEA